MTLVVSSEAASSLGFDLQDAVKTFAAQVVAHAQTVNVAAPTAHPLVELIVRQHNGEFSIRKMNDPEPPPVLTFTDKKHAKKAALAATRWDHETSGLTFDGHIIATDVVSQTKIIGAVVGVQLDPTATLNWKTAEGDFIPLSASSIIAIGQAMRAHVQACVDREAALVSVINAAADEAALDAIDITVGWPT